MKKQQFFYEPVPEQNVLMSILSTAAEPSTVRNRKVLVTARFLYNFRITWIYSSSGETYFKCIFYIYNIYIIIFNHRCWLADSETNKNKTQIYKYIYGRGTRKENVPYRQEFSVFFNKNSYEKYIGCVWVSGFYLYNYVVFRNGIFKIFYLLTQYILEWFLNIFHNGFFFNFI